MSLSYASTLNVVMFVSPGFSIGRLPHWFYYDNTTHQYQCGYELSCSSNKEVEIADGLRATSAGEEDQYYYWLLSIQTQSHNQQHQ